MAVRFPLPEPDPKALEGEEVKTLAKALGKVLVTKAGPALRRRKLDEAWKTARNL